MTLQVLETQLVAPFREKKETIEKIFNQLQTVPYVVDFLNALPVIILILNPNRQIVFSNQYLLKTFDETNIKNLLGLRPGEAFQCVHSRESASGCGTTESCQVCGAVLAVLKSQNTKAKVEREAQITAMIGGKSLSFDLLVSATPFVFMDFPLTIVCLTDISHEKRRRSLERIFFHDVLNTAGNIHNLSDMISLVEPSKRDEFLDLIYIASRQLIEEIKTQKILLEAETDEFVVQLEQVNAKELLTQMMELFQKQEIVRDITIEIKASDVDFETDRVLIIRVLFNMVKNALEGSEKGDTVTIGCEKKNGTIEFFVHNTAYIPSEIQLQLFQRSISTKGSGRGLGVYSIKLLSEKYLSGKVSFKSTRQSGTTFKVLLPISMEEYRKAVAPADGKEYHSESGRKNKMKRILVVDDEPQVRKMLKKFFEREGFEVSEAGDGKEGLKKYHENPFDLVIMDIVMPEKEGIETIRELKSNYPDVKIIAISGGGKGSPEGYLDMAKILGAIHTFAKPVMPDQLLKTVKDVLGL